MVADLIKLNSNALLLLIISLPLMVQVGAAENSDLYAKRAFELSLQKFKIAKENLERKIEECEKKKITVPPSAFKSLNINREELKTALFVLSNKAEDSCEKGLRGKFVIATSIYRTTAKHYKKPATSAFSYSEDLLFGHYWGKLEFEARYLEISDEQRKKLERIPELKKPFHLIKTLSKFEEN